jgi:hypothetical protein
MVLGWLRSITRKSMANIKSSRRHANKSNCISKDALISQIIVEIISKV